MYNKHLLFYLGLSYFFLMLLLKKYLPAWTGNENGVIENIQLLWLCAGFYYCYRIPILQLKIAYKQAAALRKAGMIYFFLLFMREISWGRTFFLNPDGSILQYSQMGLYGKMVHTIVSILIVTLISLLYRARICEILLKIVFPAKSFCLLLLFILAAWIAERTSCAFFHGEVAEELAEFGAYMMMFFLVYNTSEELKK